MNATHSMNSILSDDDRAALTQLEENMWREEIRFDIDFMDRTLAPDFFEYGRSGSLYTREQSLAVTRQPIDAILPLPGLSIRLLDQNTARVTYNSAVSYDGLVEHGRRNSICSKTDSGWVMRFHQGTPYVP